MRCVTDILGNLVDVISGSTPNSEVKAFWGGHHIWITPTDLGKLQDIYINSSERKLTDDGLKSAKLALVPENSVVMSSRAPIGHLGITATDIYTNQGCKSFICGSSLDTLFLFYYLKYRLKDIQSLGSGSTFAEVSKSMLEEFEIKFPASIIDQRNIAANLKTQLAEVEKARAALETILIEVSNLANAIIYDTLKSGQNRNYALGDVLDEVKIGIGYNWREYPVYGATRKGIALAKEPPGKHAPKYKPIIPGTIFYNPMRILIGSIAYAEDDVAKGITSPDYVVVKGKEGLVNSRWFYYWLRSPLGQQCINALARGAVRERMLFNRLAEGNIDLPSFEEQEKASYVLRNLSLSTAHLKAQYKDLLSLPNKLITQAFSEIENI